MQFKPKLMKEGWENNKKPNFMLDFGPFMLDFGPTKLPSKVFFESSSLLVVKRYSKHI